jgi:hypothetical protein
MCDDCGNTRHPMAFREWHLSHVCMAVVLLLASAIQAAEFAGGTGTPAAPYEIATARQLMSIGADPNLLGKYFALIEDIDLDPNLPGGLVFPHAVVAYDEDPYNGRPVAYTGRFYGHGHRIRHLRIEGAGMQYLGLFGRIGATGRVYDLLLEDVGIKATDHAGGLVGFNEGGLTNCSVTGRIYGPERSSRLGGLVGINTGTMIDCRADVILTAGDHGLMLGLLAGMHRGGMVNCRAGGALASGSESLYLGGLAGACIGGVIRDSHASGHIAGGDKSWALGGLTGRADSQSAVAHCSASGAVTGGRRSHDLGGLIGTCFGAEMADCFATGDVTGAEGSYGLGGLLGSCLGVAVSDCYAAGTVSGFRMLGGFVGRMQAGTSLVRCHAVGRVLQGVHPWGRGGFAGRIDSPADVRVVGCFWDVVASQAPASAAGTGLTAAQMQDPRLFQAAGWDMAGDGADGTADLWLVPQEGRYPVLAAFPAAPLRVGSDSYQPPELKGTGISSDPYRIATAEDLGAVGRYSRSAWYRLAADIDLSGITWSAPPVAVFDGVFDGHGHRIRRLALRGDTRDRLGLFGRIGRNGWVFDLGLEEVSIDAPDGSRCVGGLAGENAGHVVNCYVTAPTRSPDAQRPFGPRAGIVGGNNCRSLGGLVGVNWLGVVSDCYTVADMRAATGSKQIGGLAGYNYMGTLTNCYAAGRVRGDDPAPGPEGRGAAGLRVGIELLGAFVGRNSEHAATGSCYYLAASAGGGPDRGAGVSVTAEQMMQRATFVDWDFADTWTLCEGKGYPHLAWEGIRCDE